MRKPVFLVGAVCLVTAVAGVVVATNANAGTSSYEAEASTNTLTGGARTAACERCSGAKKVGWVGNTGVLAFTGVLAERAGATTVNVTYSSGERRTALLSVNGGTSTAITFPTTRGFDRPGTLRVTVTLKSGDNTVAFGNPSGWAPDFDKLVVLNDGTPPKPVPSVTVTGPGATATPTPTATPTATTTATPTAGPGPTEPTPPTTSDPVPTPTTPAPTDTPRPPTTQPSTSAPTATPTSATPPPSGNAALEAAVVEIVNKERAAVGCPAVKSDDRLTLAARGHSADMAARNYFQHTTPEGVEFSTRITNAGYRFSSAGENIAKGYATPVDVMKGWMNSPGHKANILKCGYKDLGVGVAADAAGSLLWTQDFAAPL
jgi:uncharacterized protein YkwD